LAYRLVYAVYTVDLVAIFECNKSVPLAICKDLHYGTLTDVAWSPCGLKLVVSATDGFASLIEFQENELGVVMSKEEHERRLEELRPSIESLDAAMFGISKGASKKSKHIPKSIVPVALETKENLPVMESDVKSAAKLPRRIQPTLVTK